MPAPTDRVRVQRRDAAHVGGDHRFATASESPNVLLTLTAKVPAQLNARDAIGDVVREICRQIEREQGLQGLGWRVVSAFNEAFNNVVEHGYDPGRRGDVSIVVTVESARVVLEILDDGLGFDFDAVSVVPLAPIESLDAGGMGLFIMRRAVSEVRYQRGAPNRLTLIQYFADCHARNESDPASKDEGSRC